MSADLVREVDLVSLDICDQGNSSGPPRRAAAETGVSPDARAVGAHRPTGHQLLFYS